MLDIDRPNPQSPYLMVVEDDAGVRRSLQLLLRGHGYAVKTHAMVDAALSDCAARAPDCLIVDYRLAGATGIELVRALRAGGWSGDAILISAHSSQDLTRRALAAGCSLVFDKPLRDHLLLDAVARLTGSERGAKGRPERTG